jgi:hypothetical protein
VTNRIVDKARREIENGNLWRAKEILQGAIRSEGYDVELFEMMGTVLLRMGDVHEAGRFLFLSGIRRPDYQEAIEIFLSRHRRKHAHDFVDLLPRKARLSRVSEYPDEVARAFRDMGFPEFLKERHATRFLPQNRHDTLLWLACGTIALVTLVLIILGLIKVSEIVR